MILAVLCLVTVTSLALNLLWLQFLKEMKQSPSFDWRLTAMIAAVVFLVVIGSSMGKHSELKAGGKVVAKRLGGRLINLHPDGLEEQRLLNVVEKWPWPRARRCHRCTCCPMPGSMRSPPVLPHRRR